MQTIGINKFNIFRDRVNLFPFLLMLTPIQSNIHVNHAFTTLYPQSDIYITVTTMTTASRKKKSNLYNIEILNSYQMLATDKISNIFTSTKKALR